MLLQAYDFVYLYEQVRLHAAGRRQRSVGQHYGRHRLGAADAFGPTVRHHLSVVDEADGTRWARPKGVRSGCPPERTSPYEFYQYWINVADQDVLMCLRFLTEINREEIEDLQTAVAEQPHLRRAQQRLASWLTEFIHGPEGLITAERAREVFFGAEISDLNDQQLLQILADVPHAEITADELNNGLGISDALVRVGLASSKSEARRTAKQGGAYVNNRAVPEEHVLTAKDLASESVIVLRSGKKKFALLQAAR
jgi:tyrosyl-tRNA synthetase